MKKLTLIISSFILIIGCTEKVYSIDDLRDIGFEDIGGQGITDTDRFVGTYEYVISEGNAMELTRRYPVRLQVIATKFEDTKTANEYKETMEENPTEFFGRYHKCFINNLYIGIKRDSNYSNYQRICDYIVIDLK
tara:strand:- start:244 stop:648 length:405 start_codon:yes stop_codon:yes gene_type:complete